MLYKTAQEEALVLLVAFLTEGLLLKYAPLSLLGTSHSYHVLTSDGSDSRPKRIPIADQVLICEAVDLNGTQGFFSPLAAFKPQSEVFYVYSN